MKKSIRVSEPSPEMQEKIRRARCAIVGENPQGAMRHCQPEDAHGEMSILWA